MQRLASRMAFFVVAYAWVCTFTPGGWHHGGCACRATPIVRGA